MFPMTTWPYNFSMPLKLERLQAGPGNLSILDEIAFNMH